MNDLFTDYAHNFSENVDIKKSIFGGLRPFYKNPSNYAVLQISKFQILS